MPIKRKKSRFPSFLVDLATIISIDLENGDKLKFPLNGNYSLASNIAGNQIWIISRKGAKSVDASDEKGSKLYEKFTGFEHDNIAKLVQLSPKNMVRIGRAMNIVYRSDKFSATGKVSKYIHAFQQYPIVSADNIRSPKIIAIRGGKLKIERRGITG